MPTRGLEQSLAVEPVVAHDSLASTEQQEKEPQPRALFHDGNVVYLDSKDKKLEAPVDGLTGMPLPVLPPEEVPPFRSPDIANWHHHYHPSNDKLLNGSNGLAVRHSRVQLLPIETHHDVYHGIFEGPALPRRNEERFGQIILASAGYVPPHAIDVHKDDPTEPVELKLKMRQRLQTSGELEVRGLGNIATFMKNHLIRQDFSHVEENVIDEFLTTRDLDRRWFLGHWLLAIASEMAVEPVEPIYRQALDEGLIRQQKSKLPNLVKSHVSTRKMSQKAITGLRRHLTAQRT